MKRFAHIYLSCLLSLGSSVVYSQNIDSLKKALSNATHDTTRCKVLNILIETEGDDAVWPRYNIEMKNLAEKNLKTRSFTDPLYRFFLKYRAEALNNLGYQARQQASITDALNYFNQSLEIRKKLKDSRGIATSLQNIGTLYDDLGNIPLALKYYTESMNIFEALKDKYGIAYALNSIAVIFYNQGDIPKALQYYEKSLQLREQINDKRGISNSLSNIGFIHKNQGDLRKALEYFDKSLAICIELGDKWSLGYALNNVGSIHSALGDTVKAMEFYNKSLQVREEIGDLQGVAISINNIGLIYEYKGDIPKAISYYNRSLDIFEKMGDKQGAAYSLHNIGDLYFRKKEYARSTAYALRSMKISRELEFPENVRDAAELLSKNYKAIKNPKEALHYCEIYISMRDSLNNESTRKASVRSQLKYEYDKKMATDSVEHAKETEIKKVLIAKQETELNAKKNQQYALFGGLGLVMVFAGFMYNRFRLTQKQKQIIESQKKIVEAKQKEILDSIYYARRIQQALITNEKYIDKNLNKLRAN
jgi:tetratricopeptide (TPR) repeat protein